MRRRNLNGQSGSSCDFRSMNWLVFSVSLKPLLSFQFERREQVQPNNNNDNNKFSLRRRQEGATCLAQLRHLSADARPFEFCTSARALCRRAAQLWRKSGPSRAKCVARHSTAPLGGARRTFAAEKTREQLTRVGGKQPAPLETQTNYQLAAATIKAD